MPSYIAALIGVWPSSSSRSRSVSYICAHHRTFKQTLYLFIIVMLVCSLNNAAIRMSNPHTNSWGNIAHSRFTDQSWATTYYVSLTKSICLFSIWSLRYGRFLFICIVLSYRYNSVVVSVTVSLSLMRDRLTQIWKS